MVTMSVVCSKEYAAHGRAAEPLEAPIRIATASGYQFVQDKMDELERTLAGETGDVITNRIIVLDVLHPEVPVIDLIDLPGIVTVNVNAEAKREAVESVISSQIKADRKHGMTSFYLVVVPAGERPNTNGALQYIQAQGLLDRAIGVFTKADEVKRPENLLAFVTGQDFEDEDDGSVITAASLGEVKLSKGWTATMLEMPKRMVVCENGTKVNYYTAHATERLKKQEDTEKLFFGGPAAKPIMQELYNQGFAGTGALAAKLTREYFEYSRGNWLQVTLTRLLEYELELKSKLCLLGVTDPLAMDELASEEVAKTLNDGATLLAERFVQEVLLSELIPLVETELREMHKKKVPAHELDAMLWKARAAIEDKVAVAVEKASSFYAAEIGKLLGAPIQVTAVVAEAERREEVEDEDEDVFEAPLDVVPQPLRMRFWSVSGNLMRSLFGTTTSVPPKGIELHKQVVAQPIVQLSQYPNFIGAVCQVVRGVSVEASKKISEAAARVVEQLTADVSMYCVFKPNALCDNVTVEIAGFTDALKTAFIRHLPSPATLKRVVAESNELQLSSFEEHGEAKEQRRELSERIERVRNAAKGLIAALDVDESQPLDGAWLHKLQEDKGLPLDNPILHYTPPEPEPEEEPPVVVEEDE